MKAVWPVLISIALTVSAMAFVAAISGNWSSFVDAAFGAAFGTCLYAMFWEKD